MVSISVKWFFYSSLFHFVGQHTRDPDVPVYVFLSTVYCSNIVYSICWYTLYTYTVQTACGLPAGRRAPDALYENGLQRDLFLPFIARLKAAARVLDIASDTDYRQLAQHRRGLFYTPADFDAPDAEADAQFAALAAACHEPITNARVQVAMGRHLSVPAASARPADPARNFAEELVWTCKTMLLLQSHKAAMPVWLWGGFCTCGMVDFMGSDGLWYLGIVCPKCCPTPSACCSDVLAWCENTTILKVPP